MFVMDMPDVAPQYAPVMVVRASQAQRGPATTDRTIGVCHLVENPVRVLEGGGYSAVNSISPGGSAEVYFLSVENRNVGEKPRVTTVLRNPEHGTLEQSIDHGGTGFMYLPKPGYFGRDRATFLVEIDGMKVKLEYFFKVLAGVADDNYDDKRYCPKGEQWKISLLNLPTDTSTVQPLLSYTGITSTAKIEVSDLVNGAVGSIQGNTITLDANAAGYNWFVDATPWVNEEYLPTSNPNEWVAKSGGAAAGKMDMLSVLLHEYGHTLGIEHSANPHDLMASTLTPGVRRLPSAGELALMAQLIGQAKDEPQANGRQMG